MNSDDNVPDTIRETIEAANKAIETNPSAAEITKAMNALAPAAAETLNEVVEAAGNAIPTIPNPNTVAATSDETTEIQPRPFSAGGPTGEFRQPPASAVAGPPAPAPNTFTAAIEFRWQQAGEIPTTGRNISGSANVGKLDPLHLSLQRNERRHGAVLHELAISAARQNGAEI